MFQATVGQVLKSVCAASWALCLAFAPVADAPARGPAWDQAVIASIALTELPRQGQHTYRLIFKGGPFPYEKDGAVFGNRERLLPVQPRGFYREYTVKTPYKRDRGARRIVCGGLQPTQPEACYYTSDHYASFRRIVP